MENDRQAKSKASSEEKENKFQFNPLHNKLAAEEINKISFAPRIDCNLIFDSVRLPWKILQLCLHQINCKISHMDE